jgi:hypothetical protein
VATPNHPPLANYNYAMKYNPNELNSWRASPSRKSSPDSSRQRTTKPRFYRTVLVFRALWIALIVIALQACITIGTPSILIIAFGVLGAIVASELAQREISHARFILLLSYLVGAYYATFWLAHEITATLNLITFAVDRFELHTGSCVSSFVLSALASWAFWRIRSSLTVEALLFIVIGILLFSSHRNFHLDRPKILNSIAWQLRLDHIAMLTLIGSLLTALSLTYLYFASLAVRTRVDGRIDRHPLSKPRIFIASVCLITFALTLYLVQRAVYQHYSAAMLARAANGVGMNSNPGVSPLSFQSALGSTNQPAALVRLEGDYSNNPFSPMMYLRESALSTFNGKEMVFAGRAYDTDLPIIAPRDSFSRNEDPELGERTPLIQSVYLLAEHDHAFATDYPASIVQLKNPRPNRFKATYRAYSVAPAFSLAGIVDYQVGDPRWSLDIKEHFLTKHPDSRYSDLARELTKDAKSPVAQLNAITTHLSKTAIYTLTPNHDVKPNDDPVAPFLFGDHRGYCVHFAHAIVYMARSLGIPARIGTGYLTDLSQAKDGHILLRMSDRHAWAEAFISGIGWVPFDIQPEQVESHAETQVDAKLLEELMGALEPGEEILPKDLVKDEGGITEPSESWAPSKGLMLALVIGSILALYLIKISVRYRWYIAPTPKLALRWAYISAASTLYDIGIARNYGETRSQFACRSPEEALEPIVQLIIQQAYSCADNPNRKEIASSMRLTREKLSKLPRKRRVIAAINPSSASHAIGTLFNEATW